MVARLAVLAGLISFSSCLGGPGSVKKSSGDPIRVESALFIPVSDDQNRLIAGNIVLAEEQDLCRSLRGGRLPRGLRGVQFKVFRVSSGAVLAPDVGEYTILSSAPTKPGSYAAGDLVEMDYNCSQTASAKDMMLNSGYLNIDEFSTRRDGVVSGTFEALYQGGEEVTGRFSAEYCDLSAARISCQ